MAGLLALALAEALNAGAVDTRRAVTNAGFAVASGAALASGVVSLLPRPNRTRGRWLFVLACGFWLFGNCWWFYYQQFASVQPYPSWADAGYLGAIVSVIAAVLVSQQSKHSARVMTRDIVDAALACLGIFAVTWVAYLDETLRAAHASTLLATVVLASYPALDVVVVVVIGLQLRSDRPKDPLLTLLGLAMVCYAVADTGWNLASVHGGYTPGATPSDTLWLVAYGLLALVPWTKTRVHPSKPAARQGGWPDLVPAITGLLAVPMLLLVHRTHIGLFEELAVVGIVAGTISRLILILRDLRSTANTLEARVLERTQDLERSRDRSHHDATHDPLTGLLNRRGLTQAFGRPSTRSYAPDDGDAFILIDLDDFKVVNDTLGHTAGDELLTVVAARILDAVRGREDAVARLGGDEFAILMRGVNQTQARDVTERLIATVATTARLTAGHLLHPTLSAGLVITDARADQEQVLSRADIAMYAAKHAGKNRYQEYDHARHGRRPATRGNLTVTEPRPSSRQAPTPS